MEWYSLKNIKKIENNEDDLYCISISGEDKNFLIGEIECPTHNSESSQQEQSMKDECLTCIGSIARLGRAAGVFLVTAMQRVDAKLLPGEIKNNHTNRIGCGRMDSTPSLMTFDSAVGCRTRQSPKGGVCIQVQGVPFYGQGFFADESWADKFFERFGGYENWLKTKNLKGNGVKFEIDESMKPQQELDASSDWDEDMDEIYDLKK